MGVTKGIGVDKGRVGRVASIKTLEQFDGLDDKAVIAPESNSGNDVCVASGGGNSFGENLRAIVG